MELEQKHIPSSLNSFSSSSTTDSTSDDNRKRRKKSSSSSKVKKKKSSKKKYENRKKESKKKRSSSRRRRRSMNDGTDDDDSSAYDENSVEAESAEDTDMMIDQKRKHPKKSKKKKKHKQKKRRRSKSYKHDDDDENDTDTDDSSSDSEVSTTNKRSTLLVRVEKQKHKQQQQTQQNEDKFVQNYQLADSLYELFINHSIFCNDLPILLVQLANGSTFDLRSMPQNVSQLLSNVLTCLQPYGVSFNMYNDNVWRWINPSTVSFRSNNNNTVRSSCTSSSSNELVLVKIIRTMLNDIGFTMDASFGITNNDKAMIVQQTIKQKDSTRNKAYKDVSVSSSKNQDRYEKKHNHSTVDETTTSSVIIDNNNNTVQQKKYTSIEKSIIQVTNDLLLIVPTSTSSTSNINSKTTANNSGDDNQQQLQQQKDKWANELISLCQMILNDECISIDTIPDATIRSKLEQLFIVCQLEKSEMEQEEDNHDDDNNEENIKNNSSSTYGFSLPENDSDDDDNDNDNNNHNTRLSSENLISLVIDTCLSNQANSRSIQLQQQQQQIAAKTKRTIGPSLGPSQSSLLQYEHNTSSGNNSHDPNKKLHDESTDDDDEDDDNGPQLMGSRLCRRPVPYIAHTNVSDSSNNNNQEPIRREEWMTIVPEKFDFLSSIKTSTGALLRNRTFEGKKRAPNSNNNNDDDNDNNDNNNVKQKPMDPLLQKELQLIQEKIDNNRGPSLLQLHQQKLKEQQKEQHQDNKNNKSNNKKQQSSSSTSWKWNRENDLDSGRRVDKEALQMIYGQAGNDLKTKFHKG